MRSMNQVWGFALAGCVTMLSATAGLASEQPAREDQIIQNPSDAGLVRAGENLQAFNAPPPVGEGFGFDTHAASPAEPCSSEDAGAWRVMVLHGPDQPEIVTGGLDSASPGSRLLRLEPTC